MVTGAGNGLGKQFARRFAHEGPKVSICDRVQANLAKARRHFKEEWIQVYAVRCDGMQYDGLQNFVELTAQRSGINDVLVDNAKDTGGSIINLGSRAGVEGSVNHAAYDASNPFNRYGDPYSDVAPVVAVLAYDDSRWMTGQTLHAEGGLGMSA